jgi:hypothetical protein
MPERPRPDMDHTRDALRRHDDRVADEEPDEDEDAEPADEDEDGDGDADES